MALEQSTPNTDYVYPTYHHPLCIHCNLCIKSCATDAIQTVEHKKQIAPDRCIACGHCIGVCPTGALSAPSNIPTLKHDLQEKETPIAVILSPECALSFAIDSLPYKLRSIGFDYVFDLKTARELHALTYAHIIERVHGTTLFSPACPAMQQYIHQFHKNYERQIIPLKPPHILLASLIRQNLKNVHIYYVTPCITEQLLLTNLRYQTLPITIAELTTLLQQRYNKVRARHDYAVDRLELIPTPTKPLPLDSYQSFLHANGFPITQESHLSNITTIKERFKDRRFLNNKRLLEAYFCNDGCCNGPGLVDESSPKQARHSIRSYEMLLDKTYPKNTQKKKATPQHEPHRFADFLGQTIQHIFRARGIFEPTKTLAETLDGHHCKIQLQSKKKAINCSLDVSLFEERN